MFILWFIFFLFLLCNFIDAMAARRHWMHQTNLMHLITSPINAISHVATPNWLRNTLTHGNGIIHDPRVVFPNRKLLLENFGSIYEEAMRALDHSKSIMNDVFFRGIADYGWKRFYLKWYGPLDPLAKRICPITCSLLESMPEVKLGMFSILEPGSHIKPHYGPSRMCLRYHLGISTPNDDKCFININGTSYSWRDKQDIVFDDTRLHFVENNTNKSRLILFLDIERPTQGPLQIANKAFINYLGPLTTRMNDDQETI